jgi:S1-C subfamily serine protease
LGTSGLTGQAQGPAVPLTLLRDGKELELTAGPGKLGVQVK